MSEEVDPSAAFTKLFELRSKETENIIKGSQLSAKLRCGPQWWAQAARGIIRLVAAYIPSQIPAKIAKSFTPSFADEKFMEEVRSKYKK